MNKISFLVSFFSFLFIPHVGCKTPSPGDKCKNTVVDCVNLCLKKFALNSSNLIFKLEKWRVEVESTERKV